MSDESLTHEYYELIKREHKDLGEAIQTAKKRFNAQPMDPSAIQQAIQRLCQLVESHFIHEEEGGYMREAIARAPRIAKRANVLLTQHQEMLATAKGICESVQNLDDVKFDGIQRVFAGFVQDLAKHEAGENAILLEAYTDDIGTKD